MDWFAAGWLIAGVVLMVAELLLPGFVVVFFGAAAVLVGAVLWLGLLEGWTAATALWLMASVGLAVGFRGTAKRLLPGDTERASTDEDLDALGQVVEVLEDVGPFETGRIRFRGVSWAAQTIRGHIPAGRRARVMTRDNLIWIVEPVDELTGPSDDAGA